MKYISNFFTQKAFGVALLLTFFLTQLLERSAIAQSYVPEENNTLIKVKPKVTIQAYAFPLDHVTLLPSPFATARDVDRKYLLLLEPDRLISQFRSHSGLKPKAEKY